MTDVAGFFAQRFFQIGIDYGVYFAKMKTPKYKGTIRMVLLRSSSFDPAGIIFRRIRSGLLLNSHREDQVKSLLFRKVKLLMALN